MKTKNKLAIILLIFFISFSPVSLRSLIDRSQAADLEEINSDQEWTTDRIINNNIIIKAGVTLVVKKGVTLTFDNGNININGNMVVTGTSKNPVTFKKAADTFYNYSINVGLSGSLMMRNVDISGAGTGFSWAQNKSMINTVNAASYQGGINVADGGSLDVQGCNFHDNEIAIYIGNKTAGKIVVNRSKFSNSCSMDIMNMGSLPAGSVDFRYNWWGSADGPSKICQTYKGKTDCFNDKIGGDVDFSDWLTNENFHDPVVIIPGVFGSQKEEGIWKIDPIFHVYDNLFDEFVKNGYVSGKDLFIFPYEWRDSNVENAIKLRYKIAEIKSIANWPKVDIVAHSMGGLMAREYIESNAYSNDIDQLITLGTPNYGSPEIYPLWEAGKSIGAVQTGMKKFLSQEMEEAGYKNMFEYIRNRPIYSAKELLPNYEYLYDVDMKQPLLYPADYPVNTFLDNLNSANNVKKMANVEYTKITGNVASDISTILGFNVMKVDMGGIWEHGYPLSFEIPILGDKGAVRGYGDRTVPLSSAKSTEITADNYLELESAHTNLPTDAQKDVLETLTGVRPSSAVTDSMIKNMLQVLVHSPIDIQIISPSGKKYGKDFENNKNFENIDGSFYTGFDTKNEFITIPNPEDGEYRIITQGTGTGGEYRVETSKISQNESDQATESTVEISGTAVADKIEEAKIEVKGDQVIEKKHDTIAPETAIELLGTKGLNDWYTSDVNVALSAMDNENGSGIAKTEYSLDGGATWNAYSQPFTISQEGSTTVQYFSTDKQENKEAIKNETIKIDKTAPEAKLAFNPQTQKFDITGADNLSPSVAVSLVETKQLIDNGSNVEITQKKPRFFEWLRKDEERKKKIISTATLTDEAGHTAVVVFEKKKDENHRIDLSISSIDYDGNLQAFSNTALKYKWQYNEKKKAYAMFVSNAMVSGVMTEFHYRPKKNITIIMQKPQEMDEGEWDDDVDIRPIRENLVGMVVPGLATEKGIIKTIY